MKRTGVCVAITLQLAVSLSAAAAGWAHYHNDRFGYAIDIPPGFSPIAEADNGDGGVSTSPDGEDELRVWGGYVLEGDFASEIASRIDSDRSDGWDLTYVSRHSTTASWSGTRNERIVYVRALAGCDGAADYFRLEYARRDLKSYGPVVDRLVRSFKSGC